MLLVTDEEYVELVEGLTEDEYITKTEVKSVRKMISGKLWIDTRKFTNRQNKCIPTGMYKVFGNSISKSAVDVHTEIVQYFLDPDQKNLRDILRKSTKNNKVPTVLGLLTSTTLTDLVTNMSFTCCVVATIDMLP